MTKWSIDPHDLKDIPTFNRKEMDNHYEWIIKMDATIDTSKKIPIEERMDNHYEWIHDLERRICKIEEKEELKMKNRHIDMGMDPTTDYPSLHEELDQLNNGYADYAEDLKDCSHDYLVNLIKQMDISAKDAGKQIEHKAENEQNLRTALDAMYGKQLLVKTALRDLFEFAELGEYSGLSSDDEMDDE